LLIVAQFEQKTGTSVTLVLGSTGLLAQQIRNGAPADVFFAANESFVTELAAENLTLRHTHALYARGRVAAVTLKESGLRINSLADLAEARVRRIAIANPQHAPYGLAARQALEAAGLWATLEPKLVFGENVSRLRSSCRSGSRSGTCRPIGCRTHPISAGRLWTIGALAPQPDGRVLAARSRPAPRCRSSNSSMASRGEP
jgi:molybdate transport system substrate-binding protein